MLEIRTILCPTDLSTAAADAFQLACALARDHRAKLIVFHAYPTPVGGADRVDRARDDSLEPGLLQTLRANTPEYPGVDVEFRVTEGPAAEAIIRAARDCDLVVMGTHGRSGFRRAVFGSVAEDVLRNSPCPVVTVRPFTRIPVATESGEDQA